MIFVNRYAILPLIPKTIFVQHCWVEILAFVFVLFHRDGFFKFIFYCSLCQRFSSAYLDAQTLPPATTFSYYLLCQVWPNWAFSLVFVQLACWHTDVSIWSGGQLWQLSPFHRRRHCWCAHTLLPMRLGKFSVLALRCSRALLHNLQPTSERHLILASHLATRMIPPIAIISRLLCIQGTRGSFKSFCKNTLLSFRRNMKSAVHVPYAGWLILPCSAEHTHMISRIFYHQSKCSAARSLYDAGPHIVACVCSPLWHHLCIIFHIIAWVCTIVPKHL